MSGVVRLDRPWGHASSLHRPRHPSAAEPAWPSGVFDINVSKFHIFIVFKGRNYINLMKNGTTLPHPIPQSHGFQDFVISFIISIYINMLLLLLYCFLKFETSHGFPLWKMTVSLVCLAINAHTRAHAQAPHPQTHTDNTAYTLAPLWPPPHSFPHTPQLPVRSVLSFLRLPG